MTKDAGEQSKTFSKAVMAQATYNHGKPGSAKNLATQFRNLGEPYDGTAIFFWEKCRIKAERPADMGELLREASKANMIRALQNPQSDFFDNITIISKALDKRDSGFFRKLADGLDKLNDDPFSMEFGPIIHDMYLTWMCPDIAGCFWTRLPYKTYVEKGIEPTKAQLRELVLRRRAILSLLKKGVIRHVCYAQDEQPPDVELKITEEIGRLGEPRWTHLWQKTGLSHLKPGTSRRPKGP